VSASESGDLAKAFFYFFRERGRGMMLPVGVAVNCIQFEMESWAGAQRAFALKSFHKNNDSYTLPPNVNFARNSRFIETVKCRQLMP